MTSNLLSSKFRPIIEIQTHQGPEAPSPIQYKSASNHHNAQELATRFLFECGEKTTLHLTVLYVNASCLYPLHLIGAKLKTNPLTAAVAAQIYHRFLDAVNDSSYDPYVSEKHRKKKNRICVNVCYVFNR